MAGATTGILRFASGRSISVHFPASGAIGSYVTMAGENVAIATSADEYKFESDDVAVDIAGGPATGMLMFEMNGKMTHSMWDQTQHLITNLHRPALNWRVFAGQTMKLRVAATLAA